MGGVGLRPRVDSYQLMWAGSWLLQQHACLKLGPTGFCVSVSGHTDKWRQRRRQRRQRRQRRSRWDGAKTPGPDRTAEWSRSGSRAADEEPRGPRADCSSLSSLRPHRPHDSPCGSAGSPSSPSSRSTGWSAPAPVFHSGNGCGRWQFSCGPPSWCSRWICAAETTGTWTHRPALAWRCSSEVTMKPRPTSRDRRRTSEEVWRNSWWTELTEKVNWSS